MSEVVAFDLSGLNVDLPPYQVPPDTWTFFRNIEVNEGFAARARGFGRVFGATLFLPRWILNSQREGVSEFVYGGDTAIAETDGTAHNDITGALVFDSSGAGNPWTGGTINNIAVMNNLTGPAMSWTSGDVASLILPDWPTTRFAGAMRVYREFLIAMDLTEAGARDSDLVRWSDAAPPNDVPQSWTAGSQSQAGSASASFTPGDIVDGLTLRDSFYIYKTHATYIMQLVGGQLVMNVRPVFSTLGMLARGCAAEWRGSHIILTDGDVVMHNGIEAQSLIDRRIRRALFDNLDVDNFNNSFVVADKERQEIWVCIPETGNTFANIAGVWSIADNKWGIRELGVNTWPHGVEGVLRVPIAEPTYDTRTTLYSTDSSRYSDTGISPSQEELVFADAGSLIQSINASDSFDGVTPEATCQRIGLDFGKPTRFKLVRRIWPKIEGLSGAIVQVRVGAQENVNSPVAWDAYQDYVIQETESLAFSASGRFIAVEFRSNEDATWRSPAFDIEVMLQGQF